MQKFQRLWLKDLLQVGKKLIGTLIEEIQPEVIYTKEFENEK